METLDRIAIKPGVVLPPLVHHACPNQSDRQGHAVRLLVYHESAGFYKSDIKYLCTPTIHDKHGNVISGPDASAHGVLREDGKELTQLVPLHKKAWHAADANAYSIGIEHSNRTSKGFYNEMQLQESARIYGWLVIHYDIPIKIAKKQGDHYVGICRHQDLGSYGGGHTQCGMTDWWFHLWLEMIHEQVERGGYRKHYMTI